MNEREIFLNEGWSLCVLADADVHGEIRTGEEVADATRIPAAVPGDWPLDFVRAGRMDNPYFEDRYLNLRKYENSHVIYITRFDYSETPVGREFLRFEGIDTVADIYLNGEHIGHARNMYIPHEFALPNLRQGQNELLVHILPVLLTARETPLPALCTAQKYGYEALVVRKAAHMFGWDICPRILSSGLWKPVSLIRKKPVRIDDVYFFVSRLCKNGCAHACLRWRTELGREEAGRYAIRVAGRCKDSRFETAQTLWSYAGQITLDIPDAKLWWPRNYGEANLYDVTVTLERDGVAADTLTFRQGLRTVQLVRDDVLNQHNEGRFCFVINGKSVFLMGTNWVPADAFHSNDVNRIPKILPLIRDIGCNALRVWGGGVYEPDSFYDWCDENGVVVWQDFMMACGVYPHTEDFQTQLRCEAESVVRRLRHHASLCLWAGDNECDQNYCWHNMRVDPTLNVLTRRLLPEVIMQEDFTTPYLPSSPYVSHDAFVTDNQCNTPEQHLWGPRDYFKSPFYHEHTAVFASETGYHGCTSPASLGKFIAADHLWPVENNPMYIYHCASPELDDAPYAYRIALMCRQIRLLFEREAQNLDEYARMSQISQAEAKKFFIENFRCRKGKKTGIIWWNIMDCWPQISDAVVDYYFCRKLAYFFIRRSQQPVCLMMGDHTGELTLYGVNEYETPQCVTYRVTDLVTGHVALTGTAVLRGDASTALAPVPDDSGFHFYFIEWTDGEKTHTNHYLQGKPRYDYDAYIRCLEKAGYAEFEGF